MSEINRMYNTVTASDVETMRKRRKLAEAQRMETQHNIVMAREEPIIGTIKGKKKIIRLHKDKSISEVER